MTIYWKRTERKRRETSGGIKKWRWHYCALSILYLRLYVFTHTAAIIAACVIKGELVEYYPLFFSKWSLVVGKKKKVLHIVLFEKRNCMSHHTKSMRYLYLCMFLCLVLSMLYNVRVVFGSEFTGISNCISPHESQFFFLY